MTEKNDFKLDVVSIRLVKEAPIYSEQSFNKPEEVAAVMGDCMCQFDREVVCVVNLRSDLKLWQWFVRFGQLPLYGLISFYNGHLQEI